MRTYVCGQVVERQELKYTLVVHGNELNCLEGFVLSPWGGGGVWNIVNT